MKYDVHLKVGLEFSAYAMEEDQALEILASRIRELKTFMKDWDVTNIVPILTPVYDEKEDK